MTNNKPSSHLLRPRKLAVEKATKGRSVIVWSKQAISIYQHSELGRETRRDKHHKLKFKV